MLLKFKILLQPATSFIYQLAMITKNFKNIYYNAE